MLLKDELKLRSLGTITPARMPLVLEDRGESVLQPPSFGEYRDYELSCKVFASFSACDAMLESQVRHAKHHIIENVYRDVRSRIHHLRMLIIGGHTEEALKLIDEIDQATKAD